MKPSSYLLSEHSEDALLRLGSSGGSENQETFSVSPCERVPLAYLIVQIEPVAD